MLKLPSDVKVTYKYAIQMTHIINTYSQLIKKWLSKNYLTKIYSGHFLLLISPILQRNNEIYVLPTLDIDTTVGKGLDYLKIFFKRNPKRQKFWFAEYTGKRSFHIYAKFYIKITEKIDDIQYIRNIIFSPFGSEIKDYIDTISSIRNVPTIRIGYRSDTGRMAMPMLLLNENFIAKSKQRGFQGIMEIQNLVSYIQNYLIPPRFILPEQYRMFVK